MKHADIKEKIIVTASQLFYKNGYNATGINEIISESGIAKATLYNHFPSKEDICLAYLNHKNTTFLTDIRSFCSKKRTGKDQILALFDFLAAFFQEKDFNGCWCIKTVAEIPKDNTRIRNEIKRQKNLFIKFIEELIEQNNTAKNAKQTLARKTYLLYESAVSESHLHQEKWPIIEAKELCALLIR